ncbi:MAG TPA: DUF1080 domain-containing protein [Terriglobia bacterium]|nr:DUF1080 domain-containing protein [Terriglobia bacterium]
MKFAAIPATAAIIFVLGAIAMTPRIKSRAATPPPAWINITPGPSLRHWTRVAIPPDRPLSKRSQWSVDAATHTLDCAGNGGHEFLRYDGRQLGDFLFHVEWRLIRRDGNKDYNSGVFVRNNSDGSIWYQAQVGSASGGYWFGYDDPAVKGPISFNLQSRMTANAVKPAGDWNTFDIRCEGKKLILKVNGTVTSKFDKCRNRKGYLGLEAEGSPIEFRNMRIKLLK